VVFEKNTTMLHWLLRCCCTESCKESFMTPWHRVMCCRSMKFSCTIIRNQCKESFCTRSGRCRSGSTIVGVYCCWFWPSYRNEIQADCFVVHDAAVRMPRMTTS
jgi:hypothetical protein